MRAHHNPGGAAPQPPAGTRLVAETPRLLLRTWHPDDLEILQSIVADPEVMRFVLEGVPWPIARTRAWLEAQRTSFAGHGFCHYAVLPREAGAPGAPIGFCGIRLGPDGRFNTGWRLARAWWGQGIASEAARAVKHHAFAELRLPHLIATAHRDNHASHRIMEKLGMSLERAYLTAAGQPKLRYRVDNPDAA